MSSISDLIERINNIINNDVQYNSYEFLNWYSDVDNYLDYKFGKNSLAYKEFKDIKFATNMYEDNDCTIINKKACKEGLIDAKKLLEKLVDF